MKPSMKRRHFLKLLSAGTVAGALPLSSCTHKKFFNPDEDILLSGGRYTHQGSQKDALIAVNLVQTEKRVIDTPFLPHGILIDPTDKQRIICVEKNAGNACEVDLQSQNVVSVFHSADDKLFSGHAAFSANGNKLYMIEFARSDQQGYIATLNGKDFARTAQLPTLGLRPHDCQLLSGDTLVISNTGRSTSGFHQPSLVYIDMMTQKMIKRVKSDNDHLNCGHFELAADGSLIVASAPVSSTDGMTGTLTGGVSMLTDEGILHSMTEPAMVVEHMTGEALGIAINEQHGIAAVTHPQANMITFWSLDNQELIKAIGVKSPRGISQTMDGESFIISYGSTAALAKISSSKLEPRPDSIVQPTYTTGEHLLNWSQQLRQIMPTRIYD